MDRGLWVVGIFIVFESIWDLGWIDEISWKLMLCCCLMMYNWYMMFVYWCYMVIGVVYVVLVEFCGGFRWVVGLVSQKTCYVIAFSRSEKGLAGRGAVNLVSQSESGFFLSSLSQRCFARRKPLYQNCKFCNFSCGNRNREPFAALGSYCYVLLLWIGLISIMW